MAHLVQMVHLVAIEYTKVRNFTQVAGMYKPQGLRYNGCCYDIHAGRVQRKLRQLFEKLKERGLKKPSLIISDAHKGLVAAIGASFPGASWQRCKVHFMRNVLIHVPHKEKERFVGLLKGIWMTTDPVIARQRAKELADEYRAKMSQSD